MPDAQIQVQAGHFPHGCLVRNLLNSSILKPFVTCVLKGVCFNQVRRAHREMFVMKGDVFIFTSPQKQEAGTPCRATQGRTANTGKGPEGVGKMRARVFIVTSVGRNQGGMCMAF